jgi:transcriptional regulator with XRE-family HTH domain
MLSTTNVVLLDVMANLTPEACRAARALLGISARELGARAGIAFESINKFENGRPMRESNKALLAAVFEGAGVEILNGSAPGARLRPIWRVDFAKAEPGFTVQPASGQAPRAFPIFPTQDAVRDWLAAQGYRMVAGDIDRWIDLP